MAYLSRPQSMFRISGYMHLYGLYDMDLAVCCPKKAVNSLRPSDAYICVAYLTIIGSDNGLSPSRRQAIIGTNAGILLIRSLGTNFSEILIEIQSFWFKKMHLKMSSAERRPFCLLLTHSLPFPPRQAITRNKEDLIMKLTRKTSLNRFKC